MPFSHKGMRRHERTSLAPLALASSRPLALALVTFAAGAVALATASAVALLTRRAKGCPMAETAAGEARTRTYHDDTRN